MLNVKRLFGAYKEIKDVVKATYKISKMTNEDYMKIASPESVKELNGIHYVPFNDMLKSKGYAFACIIESGVILTDDMFEKLSDNGKMFLLLHELGHQEYKHLEYLGANYSSTNEIVRDRLRLLKENKVMPIELEADSYVLNYMSKEDVIAALEEVNQISYKTYYAHNKELELRKEIMKEKM